MVVASSLSDFESTPKNINNAEYSTRNPPAKLPLSHDSVENNVLR
jgi:hypothetical protein